MKRSLPDIDSWLPPEPPDWGNDEYDDSTDATGNAVNDPMTVWKKMVKDEEDDDSADAKEEEVKEEADDVKERPCEVNEEPRQKKQRRHRRVRERPEETIPWDKYGKEFEHESRRPRRLYDGKDYERAEPRMRIASVCRSVISGNGDCFFCNSCTFAHFREELGRCIDIPPPNTRKRW